MKRVWILLLVMAMMLSLCACGAKEEDIYGLWQRETVYLPAYGCDADLFIAFDEEQYMEVLVDHESGDILNLEFGKWEIVKGKVEATAEDEPGTTVYKYTGGKLKNGDLKYTYVGVWDDVLELF